MILEGLYYTKEHEWVKVDGNIATIGLSNYAQDQLGEITFIELPEDGLKVSQGQEIATVESSKSASDIFSPVTGEVTEVNSELNDKPELINEDCYKNGWICKTKITDPSVIDNLMDSNQYTEHVKDL